MQIRAQVSPYHILIEALQSTITTSPIIPLTAVLALFPDPPPQLAPHREFIKTHEELIFFKTCLTLPYPSKPLGNSRSSIVLLEQQNCCSASICGRASTAGGAIVQRGRCHGGIGMAPSQIQATCGEGLGVGVESSQASKGACWPSLTLKSRLLHRI